MYIYMYVHTCIYIYVYVYIYIYIYMYVQLIYKTYYVHLQVPQHPTPHHRKPTHVTACWPVTLCV